MAGVGHVLLAVEEGVDPGQGPEDPEEGKNTHRLESRAAEQILELSPRVPPIVPGVSVELAPEPRVRGHRQENEASGNGQRSGATEQAGVVSHVLEDIEETDQIEASRERRMVPLRGHQSSGAAPPRQREVVDSRVEPDGIKMSGQLREDLAIPTAEVEDSRARRARKTASGRLANGEPPVRKPEVAVLDREQEARRFIGETGRRPGVGSHGRVRS